MMGATLNTIVAIPTQNIFDLPWRAFGSVELIPKY